MMKLNLLDQTRYYDLNDHKLIISPLLLKGSIYFKLKVRGFSKSWYTVTKVKTVTFYQEN